MKVVVCIKQVPDPATPGQLDPETHWLRRDGEVVLDPGDQFGIEAGLQLVEAHGGEVTVISMGPERGSEAIRKALAMGAHRGVLVSDPALAGSDALSTAKVLAAIVARGEWELVITATESTDASCGVVPQMLAQLLGVPAVTYAKALTSDGTHLTVTRQTEVGTDSVEADLPVVVSVTAGVNEPRYASLKGIMGAKSKPIETLDLAALGLSGVGGAASGQRVAAVVAAEQRSVGEIITDDGDAAGRIVDFLASKKVI